MKAQSGLVCRNTQIKGFFFFFFVFCWWETVMTYEEKGMWCSMSSRILTLLMRIQQLKAQKLITLEALCSCPSYSLKAMSNHSLGWTKFKCNPELGGWHRENHNHVEHTCGGCEHVCPHSITHPSRKKLCEFAFLNSESCPGAPCDAGAVLLTGVTAFQDLLFAFAEVSLLFT